MPLIAKQIYFGFLFLTFCIYSFFVYTSDTPSDAKELMTSDAQAGKVIFQQNNCFSCHQLYGLGGYMGPDLTNVISAQGKGEIYAKALIMSGTQKMPNFHLNEQEINSIIAYLKYVDKTGVSPTIKYSINSDGSVNYNE